MEKRHILSLNFNQLKAGFEKTGLKPFKAKQIYDWVYKKGVLDLSLMLNISKQDKEVLSNELNFDLPKITVEQKSTDGTVKWLFKMNDGHEIETVYIPDGKRGTLCVSSQVGCIMTCKFCHTGTQGFTRNLTTEEIVSQVWLAKKQLGDFDPTLPRKNITNIVYMGMGEPLFNTENVVNSIKILMEDEGFYFGGRKITVSTSGVVDELDKINDVGAQIAISLHATNDALRSSIMPVNNKWNLDTLFKKLRNLNLKEHRRITFEYILLKDINDSTEDALSLINLVKDLPSFINILPFNPWPGSAYEPSNWRTVSDFADIIEDSGLDVSVRRARGQDILAACGQLRGETSKFNTVSVDLPTVVEQYGTDAQKEISRVKFVKKD